MFAAIRSLPVSIKRAPRSIREPAQLASGPAKNWADIEPPSARPADTLSDPTSTLPACQHSSPPLPADAAARSLARVAPAVLASHPLPVHPPTHHTHGTSPSPTLRR